MKKRIISAAAACLVSAGIFVLSYGYSESLGQTVEYDVLEKFDSAGEFAVTETQSVPDKGIDLDLSGCELLEASESDKKSSKKKETITIKSNYATYKIETSGGKVVTYKYKKYKTSEYYLVKGTASFKDPKIKFDGYFVVDKKNNLYAVNPDGDVYFYKGKMTFPNGDVFNGEFEIDDLDYYSGTYTWKSGASYKGKFANHAIGRYDSLTKKNYGYYYYDKSKKTYLYGQFINGRIEGTAIYCKNGVKYNVTFSNSGKAVKTTKRDK